MQVKFFFQDHPSSPSSLFRRCSCSFVSPFFLFLQLPIGLLLAFGHTEANWPSLSSPQSPFLVETTHHLPPPRPIRRQLYKCRPKWRKSKTSGSSSSPVGSLEQSLPPPRILSFFDTWDLLPAFRYSPSMHGTQHRLSSTFGPCYCLSLIHGICYRPFLHMGSATVFFRNMGLATGLPRMDLGTVFYTWALALPSLTNRPHVSFRLLLCGP